MAGCEMTRKVSRPVSAGLKKSVGSNSKLSRPKLPSSRKSLKESSWYVKAAAAFAIGKSEPVRSHRR